MMRRFTCAGVIAFRLSVLGCAAVLLTACFGLGAREKAPKPKIVGFPRGNISDGTPKEPRLVGRVAMVNEEGHFVLVACEALRTPQEGTALKAMRGGTETGILNENAERRGAYVTADIVTGTPTRGDQVFQ
jgi:hypothetical protein